MDFLRRPIGSVAIICVAGSLLLPGCAPRPAHKPPERVTLAMQEFVGYGLFYLARDKGFCSSEGVDLILVDEQLDSARRDAFNNGMLDCEAGTLDLLISKRSLGVPVMAVMTLDRSYGVDGLVASAGIDTLQGLIGKKVALAAGDVGETFLSYLLHKEGLSFDRVIIVPKAPEDVAQAFLDGEADAAVTWEPQLSKALARPGSRLIASSKDLPGIIVDTLNVREDFIKNNPRAVMALMRAWFRALKYYREHPIEASESIARYYKMPAKEYRNIIAGLRWSDYEFQDTARERDALAKTFGELVELKYLSGKIAKKPPVGGAVYTALLEELYR